MSEENVKNIILENDKKIRNAVLQAEIGSTSLVYGEVINIWDTEHPRMVKVKVYGYMESKSNEIWAEVASPYASDKAGFYCYPEVGAHVIVAFVYGHSGIPVIIGSLWNDIKKIPEETANEENTVKRFLTKGKNEIRIDDSKGKETIEIKTKGKLSLILNDEKSTISLSDENKENKLEIDCKNGKINIDCKTKLSLKIGGTDIITIEKSKVESTADNFKVSSQNTDIDSKSSVKINGGPVKVKGATVDIKADGKLSLDSSGICEVKGSLLKLN